MVNHAELSLDPMGRFGSVVEQEEALGRSSVLAGHQVVDDGVDGGAEVAEHHGGHVEVLAQHGRVVVVHLGEQIPADVIGQPTDDEGQHHHHCRERHAGRDNGC